LVLGGICLGFQLGRKLTDGFDADDNPLDDRNGGRLDMHTHHDRVGLT